MVSGPKIWEDKIIDTAGLRPEAIPAWKHKLTRNLKFFKRSIDDHFRKMTKNPPLDVFILDLKYFDDIDSSLRKKVMDYVYDPNYEFSRFVNSTQFKIIN